MLPGVRRLLQKSSRRTRRKRLQLRLAEALDQLRQFGYRVFQDLKREGYHLDHVIVGPTGVFAIETNFRSIDTKLESQPRQNLSRAPSGGLLGEGAVVEKKKLKPASENAVKVDRIIKENCEFDGWIWPLVVIAGEWRVKNDLETAGARLFTMDKLVNHIVSQPSRLTSTEIKLIASHLERSAKFVVSLRKKKSEECRTRINESDDVAGQPNRLPSSVQ